MLTRGNIGYSDTLHRHELSHHTPGGEGGRDRPHRITVKTFRACFSCATARVRCSGGMPCGRCDTRSLECQYPTERRSKARLRNGSLKGPSTLEMLEVDTQSPQISSPRPSGNTAAPPHMNNDIPPHQLGQFSINGMSDTPASPKTSTHPFPSPAVHTLGKKSSDGQGSVAGPSNSQFYTPSDNTAADAATLPPGVYPSGEYDPGYGELRTRGMLPRGTTTNIIPGLREVDAAMTGPGVDMDIDMTGHSEMGLGFDPSIFDQSMISTINWLPNEFFAGPSSDQPQTSRVPQQFTPGAFPESSAARFAWQPSVINADNISCSIPENNTHTPSEPLSLGTDMGSPRRYSHVGSESSPHAESVDSGKRSTDFYVDGGGARLPRYRKKRTPWSRPATDLPTTTGQTFRENSPRRFGFPGVQEVQMENISGEVLHSIRPIEATTHGEIYRNFLSLCRNDNPFFEMFETENFPRPEECTRYLACYFDKFQAVYPIFHIPTFNVNQCHWILALAIIAIGCHSSSIHDADQSTASFHEMLRRAIHVEVTLFPLTIDKLLLNIATDSLQKEKRHAGPLPLDLLQALLLNCIGLFYSGLEKDKLSALSAFRELVSLVEDKKLLAASKPLKESNRISGEVLWQKWIDDETRKRTGYCVWVS